MPPSLWLWLAGDLAVLIPPGPRLLLLLLLLFTIRSAATSRGA